MYRPMLWAGLLTMLWLLAMPAGTMATPTAKPCTKQSLNEYITEARFLVLDEQYHAALEVIQHCLITSRPAPEAIYLKGAILENMGRRNEAVDFYRKILAKDPVAYGFLHFDLAYLYIRAKQYDGALEQFRRSETVDFQRAVREQALLHLRLHDYAQAEDQLRRLPQGDPNVYYLLAQSLMYQHKYAQSQKMIKAAQAAQPSPLLTRDLNSLSRQSDAAELANRRWRLWLTLGAEYNDNVFLDPLTDNPALVVPREEGDFAWLARANFHYRLTEGKNWALYGAAGFFNKSYFQLGESDYANFSGSLYGQINGEKWLVRVPYEYAYYFYGASHRSRLQQHSLYPTLKWDMTERITTYVYGQVQRRLYFTNESDIWRLGLRLEHLYYFGTQTKFIKLGYGVYQDDADDVSSGYTNYEVGLAAGRPIWGPLSGEVGIIYAYYEHEQRLEVSNGSPTPVPWDRDDDQFRAYATLRFRPNDRWEILATYYFTNNDSNVSGDDGFDPYNYRQNIISLMVVIGL
ncbi:MAG: hypothetical protein KQI62_03400 [Deltaproteobacteria bacterium]|nr:hypothetical protein [Deltaproteobacteria bacterium]